MLKKSIIAIIGGSVLILVLLIVFEPFQAYAALGPIDDFPIYAGSSNLRHNGQAVHYVLLNPCVGSELKKFYINALTQRDWHLRPTLANQPAGSMRFEHSSIKGFVELTISHHGGCRLGWNEVYARYVDPRLPVTANPNQNVIWIGTRLNCTEAEPLSSKLISPS